MLVIVILVSFIVGFAYGVSRWFLPAKKKQEGRELIQANLELISACYDRIEELEVEAFYSDSFSEKAGILKEQNKLREKIRLTEIKIKGIKTRYGL